MKTTLLQRMETEHPHILKMSIVLGVERMLKWNCLALIDLRNSVLQDNTPSQLSSLQSSAPLAVVVMFMYINNSADCSTLGGSELIPLLHTNPTKASYGLELHCSVYIHTQHHTAACIPIPSSTGTQYTWTSVYRLPSSGQHSACTARWSGLSCTMLTNMLVSWRADATKG